MEIKFGKFFQNAQEKDKEMKIMIEIKSDMEDISKELQYAYIKNSREREREDRRNGRRRNGLHKKITFLSLKKI